ncbi:MAG: hypothetical protein HDT30_14785 [Clostridiales bacterium]|nr:hypothetical protein [Clostridiales bacterium]
MDTVKIYEIIDKELAQGKTLEEIYVKHYNAWIAEHEKPRDKQDFEKADECLEIKDVIAALITSDVLQEKGYIRVQGKKFSYWRKMKGGKTYDSTD